MELKGDTIKRLREVSTATLCTQLFKRGLRNVYIQGIKRLTTPSGGNLVGPAFTVRNIRLMETVEDGGREARGVRRPDLDHPPQGARRGGPGVRRTGARQRRDREDGLRRLLRRR